MNSQTSTLRAPVNRNATDCKFFAAAEKLQQYLQQKHWNGHSLPGPDPGIRFNTRFFRFAKSYLSFYPWTDNVTYLQAQGYWTFSNWQMFDLTGDEQFQEIAINCSDNIIATQQPEGYWKYPNPEWKHRIATVEGCFAALGILKTYQHHPEQKYLDAVIRWFEYLTKVIGFRNQPDENMIAINYFEHDTGDIGGVPNNSTLLLWLAAKLFEATNDRKFLEPCEKTVNWLEHVQLPTGELPYMLGERPADDSIHFLCHQYNSFEFMDLVYYNKITGDDRAWPMIERLAGFLATGLTKNNTCRFDCQHDDPEVIYYTVALGRALSVATELGLGDYRGLSDQAFDQALSLQVDSGAFEFHSRKNYGLLTDRRSYPRYLSMILHHLLQEHQSRHPATGARDDSMEPGGENATT